jgi:hypothetical protein
MLTGRMNAPSFNCRFAIAPFPYCCCGEEIGMARAHAIARRAVDYFVFVPVLKTIVIPGRAQARTRNLEIPGSMLRIAPE